MMSAIESDREDPGEPASSSPYFVPVPAVDDALKSLMWLICRLLDVSVAIIVRQNKETYALFHDQTWQLRPGLSVPTSLVSTDNDLIYSDTRNLVGTSAAEIQSFLPGARFAASIPVRTSLGRYWGSLIAADGSPKLPNAFDRKLLDNFSSYVLPFIESSSPAPMPTNPVQMDSNELGSSFKDCPIPTWVYDPTTLQFLAVNDSALQVYGFSRNEFLGMTLRDIRSHDEYPKLFESATRSPSTRLEQIGIWRHSRKDGSTIWMEITTRSVQFGDIPARMVWAKDVTAEKRLEIKLDQTEAILRTIGETLTDQISVKDVNGRLQFSNEPLARSYGTTPESVVGKTDYDLLSKYRADRAHAEDQRILNSGIGLNNREESVHATDGTVSWLSISKVPVRDSTGKSFATLTVGRDITDRRRSARRLEESEAKYKSLVENHTDSIFTFDTRGRIISANTACERLLGYTVAEILERSFYTLVIAEQVVAARQDVAMAASGESTTREFEMQHKGGQKVDVSITTIPTLSGDSVSQIMAVIRDVTRAKYVELERQQLLAETNDRVDRDPVTSLLNHRAFHRRLREEIEQARVHERPLSIVLMDVDNFRFFNDAYGHIIGDGVLRQTAEVLSKLAVRYNYATPARYGGDEFALLIPDSDEEGEDLLRSRIEEVLSNMGYQPPNSPNEIPFQFSLGIAAYPHDGSGTLDLVAAAETRLHRDKTGGGDERAEQLRQLLSRSVEGFSMLDSLVTAVDNKDHYTRRHSEDVLSYSMELAKEIGLDEDLQHDVQVAALLHDVGKIGIPDYILRKPGTLTEFEYQAIKQHPMMGAIMVSAVPGFENALDATRHHHERWDGKGYPFGLRGEETPLLARLLAVADAFSAMTTDRPYRRGMPHEIALQRIEQGRGTQWDPLCVDAFLQVRQRSVARKTA